MAVNSYQLRECDQSCPVILAHRASAGTVTTNSLMEEKAKSAGFELAQIPNHLCRYPNLNPYGLEGNCFILRRKEA